MKNILIGGAWPYANGSLHLGHIAALLPGDVLARYYRAKGDRVFFVSGSDCHGTPVMLRARQEGSTPEEISSRYHDEFCVVLRQLGFSYDLYGKTSDAFHIEYVTAFHRQLYQSGLIYEKWAPQAFCAHCDKTLTDRLVSGRCPSCGQKSRGDQCDACGTVLEAEALADPCCTACGDPITFTRTKQLYIALSRLKDVFELFLAERPHWRRNAIAFTRRYLDEGLKDRAITRDLDWGIPVPKEGYGDKRIYIWAENVLGYLSASHEVANRLGIPFGEVWGKNARHYYVHGKDNIPFHSIILPALLIAHGEGFRLPDDLISSEYLTLEGRKISTSQNWAIWAGDMAQRYHPDAIRYFLLANGPEKRDTDFSWREFVERNNSELLGAYGNLVNRTLAFLVKHGDGTVPAGSLEDVCEARLADIFEQTGKRIEDGHIKEALEGIFDLVRFGNRYYDAAEPWKTRKENPEACGQTLFNCVQLVANAAVLLSPFLPFSSDAVRGWLSLDTDWSRQLVPAGHPLPEIGLLFPRLDPAVIGQEKARLGNG